MSYSVDIIGAGLAGSEAALQLADRGVAVRLFEMRPVTKTPVHKTEGCAELVCSNSLKSTKPESAAGMLKSELTALGSHLLAAAHSCSVPAGGALALDRDAFSAQVSDHIADHPLISLVRGEIVDIKADGSLIVKVDEQGREERFDAADALILATGPLTSDALGRVLMDLTGSEHMAFYDAAAPIVLADSLDTDVLFRQSRYEEGEAGDYLNAPFTKEEYEHFISELVAAERVIAKDFETKELFQACQPVEEIARKGVDAPRFGALKPVGLTDPRTGRRPWAALQLRAEDIHGQSYNLVGFQTNLTFPEQRRVFRLIPGLEKAEFARYGVMHRNTFLNAPALLDTHLRLSCVPQFKHPVFVAGQLAGTEGYCEAIMSGLYVALTTYAELTDTPMPSYPRQAVFGALLDYATSPDTKDYQPMHVNFGIIEPLEQHVRNKAERYSRYQQRGARAMDAFVDQLVENGLISRA